MRDDIIQSWYLEGILPLISYMCIRYKLPASCTYLDCVVPENIHTPPRRELEISEGEGGGSKNQEIPGGGGGVV